MMVCQYLHDQEDRRKGYTVGRNLAQDTLSTEFSQHPKSTPRVLHVLGHAHGGFDSGGVIWMCLAGEQPQRIQNEVNQGFVFLARAILSAWKLWGKEDVVK